MIRFSSLTFVAILFWVLSASAESYEKVAVLVSGGDLGSLEDSLQSIEKQAIQTYENLGYRVVLVGGTTKRGAPLSSSGLQDVLGGLKGVKDLRLDFIGHGSLQGVPDPEKKLKGIALSAGRLETSMLVANPKPGEKLMWFAANSSTADDRRMYFANRAELLGLMPETQKPIVHTRVSQSLEVFRSGNPDAVTTVNLLNCFSGALAQELRQTPNTIVYANSPHTFPALNVDERTPGKDWITPGTFLRSRTGLGFYYEQLAGAESSPITLDTARGLANFKMLKVLRENPSAWYMTGRSPMFESVIGWCESGEPGKLTNRRNPAKPVNLALQDQMDRILKSFEYVSRMPSEYDPSKKEIDVLKERYQKCLDYKPSPVKEKPLPSLRAPVKAESLSGPALENTKKDQTKIDREEARKGLQMMFDKYEQILNDPTKKSFIFEMIKVSLENDKQNLRRMNVPEDRWGSIKKIIDSVESGALDADALISNLRNNVARMKQECASGLIEESPCRDNFGAQQAMIQWLVDLREAGGKVPNCDQTDFKCLFSGEMTYTAFSFVARVWIPSPSQAPLSARQRCAEEPWLQYVKVRKSVEQDRQCYQRFLSFAPDSEWDNLGRLSELGRRKARGEEKTNETRESSSHDEKKSGVTK